MCLAWLQLARLTMCFWSSSELFWTGVTRGIEYGKEIVFLNRFWIEQINNSCEQIQLFCQKLWTTKLLRIIFQSRWPPNFHPAEFPHLNYLFSPCPLPLGRPILHAPPREHLMHTGVIRSTWSVQHDPFNMIRSTWSRPASNKVWWVYWQCPFDHLVHPYPTMNRKKQGCVNHLGRSIR